MKRWLWLVILGVVVAAAGGGVYHYATRPDPPRYVTQAAKRTDIVQLVNATGTLNPLVLSPVGSQVSGIVWKLHADFNQPVQKGQVLVELDPALFKVSVAQNEANVASARADVQKAEADLADARRQSTRAQALAQERYIAQADRDTALAKEQSAAAAVTGARARVLQAEALLSRARLDLKNSVVLSPVNGVVIARSVELGQAVVASFQAPNLFTIAEDLRKMQVLANVDEADIGMLKEGLTAQFTVDSYRGRRFAAQVSQVRNAAQTVQNVVTYVVVLNVDNNDLALKPGMTANVRLEVARRDNVLSIPNTALRFKPPVSDERGKGKDGKGAVASAGGPGASGTSDQRSDGGARGEGGWRRRGEGRPDGGAGGEGWRRRGEGRPDGGAGRPDGAPGERPGGPGADGARPEIAGRPSGEGRPGGGGRGRGNNRGTVYVLSGATLQPISVVTGITDGERTEILHGLSEGQEVVTEIARPRGSAPPAGAPGIPGMPGSSPPRGGGGGGGGRRVGL